MIKKAATASLIAISLVKPVKAETYPVSTYGDWRVSIYVGNNDNDKMSCDMITVNDPLSVYFEYWKGDTVRLVVFMEGLEENPFPQEVDLSLQVDDGEVYNFNKAHFLGNRFEFSSGAYSPFWGHLFRDIAAGNQLWLTEWSEKARVGFSLKGSSAAYRDWKDCILKLKE